MLTVRSDVQTTARDALGDLEGSVVALDPRSGAILAMYSNPTYDPNLISTNDGQTASDVKTVLDASAEKPLLARSYQERFFPGSTFKVVTATAGLTSGEVTETEPVYPVVQSYTPPLTNRPIYNFDRSNCGGALFAILEQSCNSSFAQMAAEQLGADPMIEAAEAAGFNDTPPIDLTRPASSVYPTDFGDVVREPADKAPVYEDTPALAQTAIGQNDVAATPLQMALVAAGVANEGRIMVPHVMAEVQARDGDTVARFDERPWRDSMEPEVAEIMRRAMIGVVEQGTALGVRLPGYEVGAKTGTAQLGTTPPRSHVDDRVRRSRGRRTHRRGGRHGAGRERRRRTDRRPRRRPDRQGRPAIRPRGHLTPRWCSPVPVGESCRPEPRHTRARPTAPLYATSSRSRPSTLAPAWLTKICAS